MNEEDAPAVRGPVYATIPMWVMDAQISHAAVRLYGILQWYSGRNGVAWPSRATLGERLKCSLDTVDRSIKELIGIGCLTVQKRRKNDGSLTSSYYRLWDNEVAAQKRLGVAAQERLGVAAQERLGSRKSGIRSNTTEVTPNEVKISTPSVQDEKFEALWDTSSRKIGKQATRAVVNVRLKNGATWERLMEASQNYALLKKGTEPKYIMHPATFFGSKEHWLDYLNGGEGLNVGPKRLTPEQVEIECDLAWNSLARRFAGEDDDGNKIVQSLLDQRTLTQLGKSPKVEVKAIIRALVLG